jgi:hypothetical protein
MRARTVWLVSSVILGIPFSAAAQPEHMTDEQVLASVAKAAPPQVVEGATVLNMDASGQTKTIQTGDNGWTCMMAGPTPMCADAGGMEWVEAWSSKGPAPQKLGFIYMLDGDEGASNTDPFATEQTADNHWVVTGPHVMIVGGAAKGMLENYPDTADADPSKPYVMWAGTPYEHLMLPVE